MWNVEFTDEYEQWYQSLSVLQQDALDRCVLVLAQRGPGLGRPYVDTVKGSRYAHMKELRSQSGGKPIRTFFAFDPRRSAILLIGGDKTGDKRFYQRMIPLADALYDTYLQELRNEGLLS
jgi:hypothetical protein